MSDPTLDSIEAVMAEIHTDNSGNEKEKEDGECRENEGDSGEESQLDSSVKEEIKAALMAGQKTITLSADDASLEAKILEIVRQSRHLVQGDGSQQQYIEIVNDEEGHVASRILGETETDGDPQQSSRVVNLDLMNFKLVRYHDDNTEDDGSGNSIGGLVVAEHEENEGQQYIQLTNGSDATSEDHETIHYIQNSNTHTDSKSGMQYVQVIEKDKVPLVYFTTEQPKPHKSIATTSTIISGKRKRGEFHLPPDAVNSPNFKLFIYSCKLCDFKCNAIKELTAHKATHPGIGAGRYRSLAKPPNEKPLTDLSPLGTSHMKHYEVEHCQQCDYKTVSRAHLHKHMVKIHPHLKLKTSEDTKSSNSYDAGSSKGNLTFYVCKSCSFKTESKSIFRRHKCQVNAMDEFIIP